MKLFRKIHLWLAVPFGVFFSIMCFTGFILLFKNDIAALTGCNANDIAFFKTVTQLHRWLMMVPENPHGGMSLGRFIMGVSAICGSLVLISGVVIWWPKSRKMLKSRLSLSFNKGWWRFVYDSHVSLGIYATIFLLLMSLTGPVWSFGWYRKAAVAVIGAKDGRPGGKPAEGKPFEGRGNGHRPEGKPVETVHGRPFNAHGSHSRSGKAGNERKGGSEKKQKSPAQRIFMSLHTGKWGGTITKIIYAAATLIGGFLPISGYYLWIKRISVRSRKS